MEIRTIPILTVRLDESCQPRVAIDAQILTAYRDAMAAGATFPPVKVFYDGTDYYCSSGHHRVRAARAAGFGEIECEIHDGTLADAQWDSLSQNATHGLRRTRADVQRAIEAALTHPFSEGLSNGQIAAHIDCDESTIRAWREKLTSGFPKSVTRTGRDGRTINIRNIGKGSRNLLTPA